VASYRLLIKPSAAKELEALPRKERKRLVARIQQLGLAPRSPGCEKLSGQENCRARQGNYRVLYSIDDAELAVIIVKIGHRRNVYRRRSERSN
jgi:mRNA interferase RelE/StbE